MTAVEDLLSEHLDRPDSGWSIGAFGAIAEFMRDPMEAVVQHERLTLATARGAIRIALRGDVAPVAYETVSARPERWLHGVAFCLPRDAARMSARSVITELGPDTESVLDSDRAAILFDIGAGVVNVDACVRTGDPALIEELRGLAGENLLAQPDALARIAGAHPHRVFISRLGRIEVRQRIGSDDADPPTPEGPHTHVLPKVLARGRTHSANLPLPDGYVPCLNLYPANPTFDSLGRPHGFDAEAHARFQAIMAAWGDAQTNVLKQDLMRAVGAGEAPEGFTPAGRYARAATRVALRQLAHLGAPDDHLTAWREMHDPARFDPEDHHPDH